MNNLNLNNEFSNTKLTEVCSLAEGGCGNLDGSWCCGCARDETGRLYQPEVCLKSEGGCGNRDSSWCCGCARDEDGRLYQPEVCKVSEGGCGNRDSSWCCRCLRVSRGRLFQPEVCKVSEGGCGNRDSLYICDCEITQNPPIQFSSPEYNSILTRETTLGYGCALTRSEPSPLWTPTPLSRQTTSSVGLSRQTTSSVGLSRQTTSSVGLSRQETSSVGLSRQETSSVGLSRQETSSVGLSRQETSSVGLSRLIAPAWRMSGSYTDNSYETSDEEQQDTFHTPTHSPLLQSQLLHPRPPLLTRQDTMGIGGSHNNDNNYDVYDEPVPSRLTRQECVGSLLNDDVKVERSMIVNLNGILVDLRSYDVPPNLKPGGDTPPPLDETHPPLDETPPPPPKHQPKLYRGFNNKQQAEDILPALRAWLVIQNDPDIDYEDEVWRDTRDAINDQMRRFVDDLDWWVLGAKGGPWEYCVETPDSFASTMGINDQNINYGSYKNENKGRFTERQIKLLYDTMMENTRVAMKFETRNNLFEF